MTQITIAQESINSQNIGNTLLSNPAVVGVISDFGVSANYQSGFNSIPDVQKFKSIVANYNFRKLGFGLVYKNEKDGYHFSSNIKVNLNYNLSFNDAQFRFGANIGNITTNHDYGQCAEHDFVWCGVRDYERYSLLTADIGGVAYYKRFLLTTSANQLNNYNQNNTHILVKNATTLGYQKTIKSLNVGVLASAVVQENNVTNEIQLYTQYNHLLFGIDARFGSKTSSNLDFNPSLAHSTAGVQYDKFFVNAKGGLYPKNRYT